MDLRNKVSPDQLERAKLLAVRGLLHYQPFQLADDFSVGAGLSMQSGWRTTPPPPLVDLADAARYANDDFRRRFVVDDADRAAFNVANARIRALNDGFIDDLVAAIGGVAGKTVLDVGCNSGYFAVALAQRGAAAVVGIDAEPYGDTIALLNEICGTDVQFRQWSYDGSLQAPEQYDLVISVAVLAHMSEPLRHLAWLGSASRDALWVFTHSTGISGLRLEFKAVNQYYSRPWPHCFDVVEVSRPLLHLAFDEMGFTYADMPMRNGVMPEHWRSLHGSILGRRAAARS